MSEKNEFAVTQNLHPFLVSFIYEREMSSQTSARMLGTFPSYFLQEKPVTKSANMRRFARSKKFKAWVDAFASFTTGFTSCERLVLWVYCPGWVLYPPTAPENGSNEEEIIFFEDECVVSGDK